jgi:hypothetical protein
MIVVYSSSNRGNTNKYWLTRNRRKVKVLGLKTIKERIMLKTVKNRRIKSNLQKLKSMSMINMPISISINSSYISMHQWQSQIKAIKRVMSKLERAQPPVTHALRFRMRRRSKRCGSSWPTHYADQAHHFYSKHANICSVFLQPSATSIRTSMSSSFWRNSISKRSCKQFTIDFKWFILMLQLSWRPNLTLSIQSIN